jgi:hypothetical protein
VRKRPQRHSLCIMYIENRELKVEAGEMGDVTSPIVARVIFMDNSPEGVHSNRRLGGSERA